MNNISNLNSEDRPLDSSVNSVSCNDSDLTEYLANLSPKMTEEMAKVSLVSSQIMQKELLFILEQLREQEFDLSITTETILQKNSFEINEKF